MLTVRMRSDGMVCRYSSKLISRRAPRSPRAGFLGSSGPVTTRKKPCVQRAGVSTRRGSRRHLCYPAEAAAGRSEKRHKARAMALADERVTVVERTLEDDAATRRLGADIAELAAGGMTLLLHGPLGAGKTTLAQGFAAALGTDAAASPSFVIAHLYAGGRMPLWHL